MPQLQRLSLKAQVYEIIRQKILQQEYALGEKINIDTVADELKIQQFSHSRSSDDAFSGWTH